MAEVSVLESTTRKLRWLSGGSVTCYTVTQTEDEVSLGECVRARGKDNNGDQGYGHQRRRGEDLLRS